MHYKFGKFENAITFDTDNSSFAEVSAGGFWKIENIATYNLQKNWIKVDEALLKNIIEQKAKDVPQVYISQENLEKARQLLKSFFTYLSKEMYDAIIEDTIDKNNFNWIDYDGVVSKITANKITNHLEFLYQLFSYNKYPFDIYANVYFSENPKLILENFPECIFIEFKYPNNFNYFSFCIKENHDGNFKIVCFRNGLDQE